MFTLRNRNGLMVRAIELGATITEVHVPDREGNFADITLGYDSEAGYRAGSYYLGAVVGRCANRIAGGRFTLDGEPYALAVNNGPNHLHGGLTGFDKHVWRGEPCGVPEGGQGGQAVRFSRTSPAMEEGYPGTLDVRVTYALTDDDTLRCTMEATTDAPTVCNLAQHAYWNLAGHGAGSIAGHALTLHADHYTPVDADSIPTGELADVAGTPFDFRTEKPIGSDLLRVGDEPRGYDHNFVVRGDPGALRDVARVHEPSSGRVMTVRSNQPGVQLYTGNFLDGNDPAQPAGKGGARYARHGALCLETQCFPDAIHRADWVQPVLRPGERYVHEMVMVFGTDGVPS